ncbi:MAG: Hint domain-containing protein, partial [Pseudomonadota bacterium]
MPTPVFTSTNDLQFNATDDGTSLTWTSNTLNGLNAIDVIDENDDGNLDSGVDTWANGARVYSGYTININGNDYAIFGSGTSYNIPYDAAFDDLSVFASSLNPGTTTTTENENGTAQNFCFLTGTRIATPSGQRAIETLNAGEMVLTQSGGAVPVLWLGKQTIRRSSLFAFGSGAVRIAAGALGDGVPRADLIVTGDHGLIVDGYVVNASAMVNGSTIHSVPLSDLPAEFS